MLISTNISQCSYCSITLIYSGGPTIFRMTKQSLSPLNHLPNIWQANNANFQGCPESSNDWMWLESITSLFGGHLK